MRGPRDITAGPLGLGQPYQSHADLTRQMRDDEQVPFPPADCPGQLVILVNDGRHPILTRCDRCGCEVAFRQAHPAPQGEERLTVPDKDDIPL